MAADAPRRNPTRRRRRRRRGRPPPRPARSATAAGALRRAVPPPPADARRSAAAAPSQQQQPQQQRPHLRRPRRRAGRRWRGRTRRVRTARRTGEEGAGGSPISPRSPSRDGHPAGGVRADGYRLTPQRMTQLISRTVEPPAPEHDDLVRRRHRPPSSSHGLLAKLPTCDLGRARLHTTTAPRGGRGARTRRRSPSSA